MGRYSPACSLHEPEYFLVCRSYIQHLTRRSHHCHSHPAFDEIEPLVEEEVHVGRRLQHWLCVSLLPAFVRHSGHVTDLIRSQHSHHLDHSSLAAQVLREKPKPSLR